MFTFPNNQHGISQNFFSPWPKSTQTVIRPAGIWTPDLRHTGRPTPHNTTTDCYAWLSILRQAYSLGPLFQQKTFTPGGTRNIPCKMLWYLEVLGLKDHYFTCGAYGEQFCGVYPIPIRFTSRISSQIVVIHKWIKYLYRLTSFASVNIVPG